MRNMILILPCLLLLENGNVQRDFCSLNGLGEQHMCSKTIVPVRCVGEAHVNISTSV